MLQSVNNILLLGDVAKGITRFVIGVQHNRYNCKLMGQFCFRNSSSVNVCALYNNLLVQVGLAVLQRC